jgi:hypothetical protein
MIVQKYEKKTMCSSTKERVTFFLTIVIQNQERKSQFPNKLTSPYWTAVSLPRFEVVRIR